MRCVRIAFRSVHFISTKYAVDIYCIRKIFIGYIFKSWVARRYLIVKTTSNSSPKHVCVRKMNVEKCIHSVYIYFLYKQIKASMYSYKQPFYYTDILRIIFPSMHLLPIFLLVTLDFFCMGPIELRGKQNTQMLQNEKQLSRWDSNLRPAWSTANEATAWTTPSELDSCAGWWGWWCAPRRALSRILIWTVHYYPISHAYPFNWL